MVNLASWNPNKTGDVHLAHNPISRSSILSLTVGASGSRPPSRLFSPVGTARRVYASTELCPTGSPVRSLKPVLLKIVISWSAKIEKMHTKSQGTSEEIRPLRRQLEDPFRIADNSCRHRRLFLADHFGSDESSIISLPIGFQEIEGYQQPRLFALLPHSLSLISSGVSTLKRSPPL
jgi:hypothetical protein